VQAKRKQAPLRTSGRLPSAVHTLAHDADFKENEKRKSSVNQGIQIAVHAKVCAVQLMSNSYGAHAALAAFLLDIGRNVAFRAEKQLPAFALEAGAIATVLHADVFIFLAVFNEHYFTRPMMRHYQSFNI
jgi:hypothetical protein